MKASTALEALYPEVQKKYGNARYGEYKGKTGIEVLFPNGRAFISDDDFDEFMKMHPGEPADELLFSLFVDDNDNNEDDEESFDIVPEDVSDEDEDEDGFDTDSDGDVDKKDMSNIINAINRKY